MQIVIHPVNTNLTTGLKEYIEGRLKDSFKNHPYITTMEVYVKHEEERNENEYIVEGIIHLPGAPMYADSEGPSHDVALNETINKLQRQMAKYKERFHTHRA